jgi:hypothetical protein
MPLYHYPVNILELFAHVGLKADTGPAEAFNKSLTGMKGQLVGAIAGTLSLATAIRTVNEQFSQALGMQKFVDDTGESVEEMQKWKAVAQQVSGAGATVAESIKAISSNQAKIRLGQGSISGYQLLGIDSRSDPFKVLEAIRTKTQGLSQSMRRNIAGQFGISNDLVKTLELTNAQFDEMAANAFVIPASNIESMNKARASLETVKNASNWFKASLVTQLAPAIENISKKTAEWVRQNKEGLIKGIQTAFDWLSRVVTMTVRFGMIINSAIQSTIGWKIALLGIAAVFIALNSAVALPVAGILLLMAILEDLYVYSKGGKSAFGHLVESFPALGKIFDIAFGGIKGVAEAIKAIFTGDFSGLDNMTKKWGLFGLIVNGLAHSLLFVMNLLSPEQLSKSFSSFGDFGKDIKDIGFNAALLKQFSLFGEEIGIKPKNKTENGKNTATENEPKSPKENKFSINFDNLPSFEDIKNTVDSVFDIKASIIPVSKNTSTSTNTTTTVTVAPNITINGASDPKATGESVKSVITKEVGKAYTQAQSPKREKPY